MMPRMGCRLFRPCSWALRQRNSYLLVLLTLLVLITVLYILSSLEMSPRAFSTHSTAKTLDTKTLEPPKTHQPKRKSTKTTTRRRENLILFVASSNPYKETLKQSVSTLLQAHRLNVVVRWAKSVAEDPESLARYAAVIFEGSDLYSRYSKYVEGRSVGIVVFPNSNPRRRVASVEFLPKTNSAFIVKTTNSTALRILKANHKINLKSEIAPLKFTSKPDFELLANGLLSSGDTVPVAMATKNVAFLGCTSMTSWFWKTLLLDVLYHVTSGALGFSLRRRILIDIDDIFVAPYGTKIKPDDVTAMINFQDRMRKKIPGFKFNLGFSANFYEKSSVDLEIEGDREIVKEAHHFWWFGHIFSHAQAHTFKSAEKLEEQMRKNLEFSKKHNISVGGTHYSVAPHHSGVYPVYPLLYDTWKSVWQIEVTTTEEYPHLRPDYKRRGFIYRGIKVLPRQTCTLFTKTYTFATYPGGKTRFHGTVRGELFNTILNTPISIFMTHLGNYGNDRLSLRLFEEAFGFIHAHTNLQLSTVPPKQLADEYFSLFPKEATLPLWTNPCDDPRHKEIWATPLDCTQFPDFVVVGPQKTGTTALHSFLRLHPRVKSNSNHPKHFEELQFFHSSDYEKGVEYYMSFFPRKNGDDVVSVFEKSATYFDSLVTPERMLQLLPKAKIIVILSDPGRRAHSWYQHQRAHNIEAALENSFFQVLKANHSCPSKACSLRERCLVPGLYAEHLERWLNYYDPSKIYIIDGNQLVDAPIEVMNRLQKYLGVPLVDYDTLIRYDEEKGFYCEARDVTRTKCLGTGKGRKYPALDDDSSTYVASYYREPNNRLRELLTERNWPVPNWLE